MLSSCHPAVLFYENLRKVVEMRRQITFSQLSALPNASFDREPSGPRPATRGD